jgi:TrmH family RNA methyltransferase
MNQQQKQILQLQKKARERKREHAFIIEGSKMFEEAPKERIRYTVVSESFLANSSNRRLLAGIPYEKVTDTFFASLSDTKSPQGILAVLEQYDYKLSDLLPKKEPALLLVLDTIQDPGNLGTMLRAGEAAGVTGVLMNDTTVDIYNPKVVRATMGTIYRMPFYTTKDLLGDIDHLRKLGVTFYAAHLQAENSYEAFSYREPTAFLIGNEANGLSDEVAAKTDKRIRIPMKGSVESLNAAMAATVLMFEAARQRRI